jgi:hypothetical protein
MTTREERRLQRALNELYSEVHENNIMLHQICSVVNTYLANHHRENEEDFGRNVLANLISGMADIRGICRRR